MNNFWNDIKQTFSGQKPEPDDTSKAILDIENKKKTITKASNSELTLLKEKINEEYRNIGNTVYDLYKAGDFEIEKIAGMFQTVDDFSRALDEKKAKLNEILIRYDEELKILRPTALAGQATCPKCENSYIPGEMLFCNRCGTKLPETSQDTAESASETTEQLKCPSCSAVLVSDAIFCASCGNKL